MVEEGDELDILDKVAAPLILLIIIVVLLCLPIRSFINCLVRREVDEEQSKTKYSDKVIGFMTDYDVENPVTQREGYHRLLDLKQKSSGMAHEKKEIET
mmetsp:Transcript_23397/g.17819  ORF Transcript_23397/g.17819 Transcript_23397/m.17819 type:complete len:99 (-) Transcript_23397:496-792(-)|eukprot:CAMPEP_0202965880 /NCGR_PEP_ID=MMETSP1396-20130829/10029_1 /ASSEMBLY_ACC=CAM_ASM_000872 /TAXON_ID= /ORGANISM="Pseudokeronopsis sp., Strain Brazil" /LENGTH=98 /DNA_ID=CAMNT_0049689069 /DNA_START=592 /DNA_END=888 /DNA_ORIENTATION=-